MPVDLDEAENGREPPQQSKSNALGAAGRVGLVAEIGIPGIRGDLVMSGGRTGGLEGLQTDLLSKLVKT